MQVDTMYVLIPKYGLILYLVQGHVLTGRKNVSGQREIWKV